MYISICISEEKEHGSKLTPCQCQACSDPVFKPGICRRRRPTWADRWSLVLHHPKITLTLICIQYFILQHIIYCVCIRIYIYVYIYIIICIQYLICIRSNCSFSVAKIEFPSTGYPIAGWCIRENPTKMGIWHDSIKAALGNMMECRLLWNMAGCYLKNIWNIESPLSLIPNINGFHLKRWFSMTQVLEGDLKRSLWRNMTYGR